MSNYQPTIPLQTRLDVRTIATLARYYREAGFVLHTKSAIVRQACLDLTDILVKQEKVIPSASIEQSITYLERIGMGHGSRHPTITLARSIEAEERAMVEMDKGEDIDGFYNKALEKLNEAEEDGVSEVSGE